MNTSRPVAALKVAVVLFLASSSTACSYARVGSGEVAIVRTPSGVTDKVFPTGDWQIGVWDTPTNYSVRSQEREESLEVLASNGLQIVLDTSIRYHIVPDEVVALDRELGENYYGVLLGPTLRSQARRVVGRYQPEEIYSTEREKIEREVRGGIEEAIKGRHVVLEAVLIRNVRLPASIQQAINVKLEAEQSALKMKYVLAEQEAQEQQKMMEMKAQVERDKISAESRASTMRSDALAEADSKRIEAQALADAKRSDAQAQSDFEKLIALHLTPQLLKLREIDAMTALAGSPNTKLLFMGEGGAKAPSLIDLRQGKTDNPY